MIGLDTNVLVRYFVQDDARQAAAANRLLSSFRPDAPGFVSLVVVVELVWVLDRSYGVAKERIVSIIDRLLTANEINVENMESAHRAFALFRNVNVDFADALIMAIGRDAGCSEVATFDPNAIRVGMRLLST